MIYGKKHRIVNEFKEEGELISTGLRLRDLFLEKFISNPEIVAPKDIRLNFKNKKNKTNE